MTLYKVYSAAVPTTAAMARIATGTAIKTHMHIATPTGIEARIVAWGVDFEAVPTAFVHAELINTTNVAPTGGTTVVATPVQGGGVSQVTAAFAPSAEGTVAATCEVFDAKLLLSNSYAWEWSQGREPVLAPSQVLRVRMTTAATVNALSWIMYDA